MSGALLVSQASSAQPLVRKAALIVPNIHFLETVLGASPALLDRTNRIQDQHLAGKLIQGPMLQCQEWAKIDVHQVRTPQATVRQVVIFVPLEGFLLYQPVLAPFVQLERYHKKQPPNVSSVPREDTLEQMSVSFVVQANTLRQVLTSASFVLQAKCLQKQLQNVSSVLQENT